MWFRAVAAFSLLAGAGYSASAQVPGDPPAERVARVGNTIIAAIGNRTFEQGFAATRSYSNPFGIDPTTLLDAAGAISLSEDRTGGEIAEGQFSVDFHYNTPGNKFLVSAEFPAIVPFAFKLDGVCHAGYVTGYPFADTVLELDLAGRPCHAQTVERIVWDAYIVIEDARAAPPGAERPAPPPPPEDDRRLDAVLRAAYARAVTFALEHGNYFARTEEEWAELLRDLAAAVAASGLTANVIGLPTSRTAADSNSCAPAGVMELRVSLNPAGYALVLVAVTRATMQAYTYDPLTTGGFVQTIGPQACR